MAAPDVWVAKGDGSDIIRAAAIAGVGRDYNGNVTVRLSGGEQSAVTLVAGDGQENTPADFHLQLLRVIAGLSDTAEWSIVRPAQDESHRWTWQAEPL
ncbi:MAG TPA: hypothetical protein VFV41_01300 [Streptosporangiaceae bacterium]|nr:hypothetical protein [Streptosporangiaceae bacterium]